MTKPADFASETELCAAFMKNLDAREWIAYPETAGWDILLVRADEAQVGVQAKLRLNVDVINQTLDERGVYDADRARPDFRAVLVPSHGTGKFDAIAAHLGITVISATKRDGLRDHAWTFYPHLPAEGSAGGMTAERWHDWCPSRRCKLPAYVPDVAAGAKAPHRLTDWKIGAIKIAILAERRGHVARSDFKHVRIDHRLWFTPGQQWLESREGRWIVGPRMPNFRAQHPRVYAEIERDFDKWKPEDLSDAARQIPLL